MNSIINHILIPMPHMQDPYFNRSVVFMCEHNKDGAMGLIVNKPFSDPALKELFDSFYDEFSFKLIDHMLSFFTIYIIYLCRNFLK